MTIIHKTKIPLYEILPIELVHGTEFFNQARSLLITNGLPVSDLEETNVKLWGVIINNQLIATVGGEIYDKELLLRSLSVASAYRGQGLARVFCEHIFNYALKINIKDIYLLTETATDYFFNLDFTEVPRHKAPISIQSTRQFSGLCSDKAQLLYRDIYLN